MRIMAIDYGDARTGVAVSDESATIAGEAWVIRESDPEALARAVAAEGVSRCVSTVVVGHPINMDGTAGSRAEKSEQLAESLRSLFAGYGSGDVPVVTLWDERMTTIGAHRILSDAGTFGKKRKKTVDAVAASLILEGYLSYISNQRLPGNRSD